MINRLIAVMLALLTLLSAAGETKVVEKSRKKVPEWLGAATDGFLVVTVRDNNLEGARTKALDRITEQIIRSVAVNVSVSRSNVSSEIDHNGDIDSRDAYSASSRIKAANLPFLKGISMTKAADIYWVKLREKKSGREFYDFSVKYPFSNYEQRRLIEDFEELDKQKDTELQNIEDDLRQVGSLDDIANAVARLDALEKYFFDEVRQTRVKSLRNRYNDLYRQIAVDGGFTSPTSLECGLRLGDVLIKTAAIPKAVSNCASNLSVNTDNGKYIISFDNSDCLPDEENTIEVTFRINGRKLSRVFNIPSAVASTGKFSVVPEGKVILRADSVDADARKVGGIKAGLTLNNRGGCEFGVKSLELNVPGFAAPLIAENIDRVFSSKGIIRLSVEIPGTFTVRTTATSRVRLVTGYITLVNPLSGAVERVRVSLPFTADWM